MVDPRRFEIWRLRAAGASPAPLVMILHSEWNDFLPTVVVAPVIIPVTAVQHPRVTPLLHLDGETFQVKIYELAAVARRMLLRGVHAAGSWSNDVSLALDQLFLGY